MSDSIDILDEALDKEWADFRAANIIELKNESDVLATQAVYFAAMHIASDYVMQALLACGDCGQSGDKTVATLKDFITQLGAVATCKSIAAATSSMASERGL